MTWLNGTLTRVAFRGETGFTVARVLLFAAGEAVVDRDAFEGTGAGAWDSKAKKKEKAKTAGVKADACLVSSRVGDAVPRGVVPMPRRASSSRFLSERAFLDGRRVTHLLDERRGTARFCVQNQPHRSRRG